MSGGFYIGTNIEQDPRFGDASKKLLEEMDFGKILKRPVDMTKVNIEAIKPWISERIKELLGLEDEVLHEFIVNMLEESSTPDPKMMQVNLTGFLESNTQEFMQSLWKILLEAQKGPGGIPESLIQKKIDELKHKREQEELIKANIAIANQRMRGTNTANTARKTTRAGRKSRWDSPSLDKDSGSTDDSTQHASRGRARMASNRDVLLDSFRTFTKCDQSAEEIALKRLALVAAGSRAKIGRAEVEFALGLVNQTNKLFSKGASDIRKHCDAQGPGGPEREAIQRTVRVVIAAFKFLHANRGIAGFSALALEKTMSNFLTACTNAHVGLWAWEGLVFLRKLLLEHANSHIVAPAGTNGRPRQKGSSDTARGSHVEQQEKQLSGTAATLVSTRPVRKPASRLKKEMSPSNHGGTSDSSSLVGAEGIAIGMRRLSMNKQASSEESKVSEIHFPLKHCQSDLAFNTLVITLLCNMLRALSLSPKSQLAQKHIRSLAQRQNSVLDWCLRVREMDRDSMDPFLGVCFRAYYALGSGSGGQHLAIRLLGILAYANTSKRDFRELLKYAARGAALALGSASSTISNVDCVLLHKQVAQYYASIFEHVSPLLTSASVSPELVEFCHSMAQSRQNSGDLKGSIVAVQYIAMCGQQEDERKDSCASLIARILVWDILVRDALLRGLMDTEIESVVGGFVELVEHAIDGDLRHTLAVWNSLALCADIIRRVARNVYTELRQGKTEDLQLQASKATVLALGVATRIYDVYIARGAASKAESAGGTSIAVLLSHSAESSLVLIQLALQFLEHDRDVQAEIEKHSDRLLKVCEDEKCNSDYLRNHSTVFFNRGASLYQLKIYSQAAQAIERAIDSLSQWFVLSMAKKQPTGDVFGQICKRYEVAASAYQANGDFDRAATTYARAVSLIVSHFPDQIRSVITTADQKKNGMLPPYSSLWSNSAQVEKLALFVDRYVRMCAGRLQKDAEETHAMLSLQTYMVDSLPIDRQLRGWLYELEAFYLRPFVNSATIHISNVRVAHLENALHAYGDLCPLGYARCLVELAKINRDSRNVDMCLDRLHAAVEIAKGLSEDCVYSLMTIAECYAWQGIVEIEKRASGLPYAISTALRLWTLIQRICSVPTEKEGILVLDSGCMREAVDLMILTTDLLMSRRLYSQSALILSVALDICATCEKADKTWVPVAMQCLIGLGLNSLILGDHRRAAKYFQQIDGRCEPGVLPNHIELTSKVAHSFFQLACGDLSASAESMAQASALARRSLTENTSGRLAISKRRSVNPEMLVLFSKASFTYSVMALKRGDLADSVNFGLHSYRILYSLLKSLLLSHKRSLSKSTRRFQDSNRIEPEDDPFSDSKSDKPNEDETLDDQEKSDAEFLAFSSNWELQRLLIDSLAHLSEIYSVRGSVKEAEYFLNKGLEITSQLNAPFQESFMRLREADILSRKGLWDECATSLSKLYKTATDDFPSGLITAVDALVTEGDAWRRCGMPSQAQAAYLRAKKIVTCISEDELDRDTRAIPVRIDEDTPRIERIISRLGRFEISNDSSNDLANRAGREIPDLVAALQEDIGIRQKLLSVLDGLSKDAVSKGDLKYKVVGVSSDRAVDQRSEYLLMQANILFLELQSILEADDSFNMVFKSAFVFPALQRSRAQKPRKGTLKANIKTKLAMLDTLLTSALETVVSVGSAHCVHSLSHLLVLVKAVASAFGFDSAQEDSNMLHHTLSRIIDGAKNITVVREAVDALQRKDEPISAQINSWPSETIGGKKENEISSSRTNAIDSRDTLSCSPVRFGIDSNKPSSMDQLPLSFGMLGDETSSVSPFADYDVLKRAADGKRATSDWMSNNSNAAEDDTSLERLLPSSWVVCGISIHHSSNMLLITRYEREREPITACLPMREINVDLENIALLETEDTATASVFDSVNKNIAAIIDASDKSMRVGKDCSTEAEKRTWWEQRTALDRQLGTILRNIQSEWLGGFHSLLNPADIFGAAVDTDDSEKTVALLREDIQTCIHGLLPKSFATKAKAIELTSQLCNLVLHVAMLDEDGKETDRERGNGGGDSGGEWLDVCAMLWDVYSYQGAAPQCTDDDLSKLATELKQVLDNHIRTHGLQSMPTRKAEAKQRHLILTLDKYAQQIPWESLPCLRDCPVSRMPSVAFIKHRLVAMNKGFNSQHSKLSDTLSGKGLYDTGLFSDLDIRKPLFSDSLVQPDMHQSTDISSTPSTSALPFGKDGRDISDIDNSMDGDSPGVRVDGSRVFYVLNPEGDLHRTQENFEGFVCGQQGWRGIVGRRPMNHECEYGLSANDIFVYFGHGGAEAYIQRTQVRGLRRCAVALLLGCSSGRLKPAGEYDALGTAMDYMIGGCPALVGNLWDVGDKDIDRFAASMLRKWGLARFSDGTIEVGYEPACDANGKQKDGNGGISDDSNALSLTEAVCNARKACRMPFLTGAAPVVYGLPVYLS
ncbi:separin protein [Coemansia sp. RSA 1939]|nr:separin protein [Coemansia sp. RSA 1939]